MITNFLQNIIVGSMYILMVIVGLAFLSVIPGFTIIAVIGLYVWRNRQSQKKEEDRVLNDISETIDKVHTRFRELLMVVDNPDERRNMRTEWTIDFENWLENNRYQLNDNIINRARVLYNQKFQDDMFPETKNN